MPDRIFRERHAAVVGDTVGVVAPTGQECRPARGAEREGDEGVAEPNAPGRHSVEIRRLEPRVAGRFALLFLHRAHGIPAVVVGVHEDEVGLPIGGPPAAERPEHPDSNGDGRENPAGHGPFPHFFDGS